ncbi:MAG: metallophosphoesterase [Candidatus Thorarchaeota archaeon]
MERKIIASLIGFVVVTAIVLGAASLYFNYSVNSTIEFYVLGDSQGYQGALATIVEDANENHPAFVMHCGDLTPFGQETQFQEVLETIEPLSVPFYSTLGNHDIRQNGRMVYEELFGSANYSFDFGPVHVTVFDSSTGDVDSNQLHWLENDLRGSDAEWKFVFTHMPLYDPREGEDHSLLNTTTSEYLMTLFSETGIDTVFSGHIHMFNTTYSGRVRYVVTGGAGASLAVSEPQGGFYHYIRASITYAGVDIEPVHLSRPSIDREHVLLKGNDEPVTLSLNDIMALDTIQGFSSFQNQFANWGGQGDYQGVKLSTLLSLVGGITESQTLKVISSDGFEQLFCYYNVYPNASWYSLQGDMVLAFEYNGTLVPDWSDGMRLVMIPEDGTYSLDDCLATSAPGQGGNVYSSAGARWVRYVSIVEVVG